MDLSRKWLNEFVDLPLDEVDDHTFAEAMSVSGSKVEVTHDLSQTIRNVVVGRIEALEKHPTLTVPCFMPLNSATTCCRLSSLFNTAFT